MDNDSLRSTLSSRRAEIEAERETIRIQREDLEAQEVVLLSRIDELSWALEQLDAAPAPKQAKATRRKRTRAALPSAEHVPNRKDEGKASLSPDDPQDGAGIPSRAGSSDAPAVAFPPPAESDASGAGADMPDFLKRRKAAAE